jgi:signal transduction histidine kinase
VAIVTEQPWEAIASPMLRTTQATPLVLVPGLLLAMVGLWFGARQVIQPLKNLENQAIQLAWGRFAAIRQPVGGIAEIQRLQAAMVEMARKVEAAQENLHSYIGAITTGQEDERRRLAREIHDDTLQAVIALNQRVQLARLSLSEPAASGPVQLAPINSSLGEIQELTEQTIQNLRRLTRALRPAYLEELGLVPALRMLAQEATHAGQAADAFQVHFECEGEERRLKPEVELTLYRMAQEALSNVQRHAQASQAWLSVTFDPHQVEIRVRDDGRGFRVPDHPGDFVQAGHFGLLGLSERADLIGAELSLLSTPGKGTRVTIQLKD